jgi:hypothetical protein
MGGVRLHGFGRLARGVAVAATALSCGRSAERSDATGAAGVETRSGSGAGGDGVSLAGGDSGVVTVAGDGGGGRGTLSAGGMAGTTSGAQGGRAGDFTTGAGGEMGGAGGVPSGAGGASAGRSGGGNGGPQCQPYPATPVNGDPECATIVPNASPPALKLIQSCDHDVTCAWLQPLGDLCFQPPIVQSATFNCCGWGYTVQALCPELAPDQDPLCELPIFEQDPCPSADLSCEVVIAPPDTKRPLVCCAEAPDTVPKWHSYGCRALTPNQDSRCALPIGGGLSCPDEGVSCEVLYPGDSPYAITYTCSTGTWQVL